MSGWDDDRSYYEEEDAKEAFIQETLRGISEDGIAGYLGRYGDAIDARVNDSISQAGKLKDAKFYQSSVVMAVTAIELIVRFLLLRPLVQGAFLSDEWAYLLAQRIASGRTAEDRKLLPQILKFQGLELEKLRLENGKGLWNTITKEVYSKRDRIVHAADPASKPDAELAIACAIQLRSDAVLPMAKKFGFTLEETGCWHKIKRKDMTADFTTGDPFVHEKRVLAT
jgi:hypothetical protein